MLEVRGMSITIGGTIRSVRQVDLTVPKGAIHGLIGESGCGKTMTGMALLGLLPDGAVIRADEARLDGTDLVSGAATLRGRRIALISQDPAAALNPVLRIGRQMDDVLATHTTASRVDRRAQALALLAATGLLDPAAVLAAYPHQLSGGMQQRVVIAQALATGADFLIADEPTTALDVTVGAQVLRLLRRLVAERGLTVLMITHDMDVVAEVCDRASVLYAGITVEEAPTEALLSSPRHPYTRALLAALPEAAAKGQPLAALQGSIPPARAALQGCAFAPRCPQAHVACSTAPPRREQDGRSWLCHLEAPDA